MNTLLSNDRQRITVLLLLLATFFSYSFYLYAELPVKNQVPVAEAASGKQVWQQYNCQACHQLYGLGGYLGPDLTNVYSRRGPEYVRAFLKNGTNVMPDFHLNEKQTTELIEFLKNVDASGKADPKTYTTNYDGTITQ